MNKWIRKWYEHQLNLKYNNKTVKIPEADFKYPPPSAYEVKQIDAEYGLSKFSALQRIPPSPQWRLDVNIEGIKDGN
jgi:hypothetical protein